MTVWRKPTQGKMLNVSRKSGGIIGWIKGLFNPSLVREREAEKERIAEQRQHEDARWLSERREMEAEGWGRG